jgi:HK97 family phage major capsid protein
VEHGNVVAVVEFFRHDSRKNATSTERSRRFRARARAGQRLLTLEATEGEAALIDAVLDARNGFDDANAVSVARAVLGKARGLFEMEPEAAATRIVRSLWPADHRALELVTRAASAPAATTTAGWAAELAQTRVEDLLSIFGPVSCGAALLRRGNVLAFDNANKISIPGISTAGAGFTSFVVQGQAIPVRQLVTSTGISIDPRKFATLFALTREMIESSNAEKLVRMVMVDSLAVALDAALFSSTAGDTARPPGLLVGVTPITAATGGGLAAMTKDFAALVEAVSPLCGMDLVFVTDPGTLTKIKMSVFDLPFEVLATNAVTAGTLICFGLPALVSAFTPTPRIDATRNMSISMDTAPPTDIGTTLIPLKSMFQTDSIAIRFIFDVAWNVRSASAIAEVTSITW